MSIGVERDVGYREAAPQEAPSEKRFVRRDPPWDFFDLGEWFIPLFLAFIIFFPK